MFLHIILHCVMEILLPIIALGGLYVINKQNELSDRNNNHNENFENEKHLLPNENIPNRNYPEEYPIISHDLERTEFLTANNKYGNGNGEQVYTDKFFNSTGEPRNMMTGTGTLTNVPDVIDGKKHRSLTGREVDDSYFKHNNMTPFFGSSLRNVYVDTNSNEAILDVKNGSGSQLISKKEQAPLFAPNNDLLWANGTPSNTDFVQSRVVPSMRMANVKPFAEQQVAPGLGLGFTNEGSGGFNSGMAVRETWMDRGVDDLRVANKQKASGTIIYGHEGPSHSNIKKTGNIGVVEKYRPDTYFDMNQDRYFTTTGVEKGQTLHSIPVFHPQTRTETTASYVGGASHQNTSTYVEGEFMPSHNQQLGAYPTMVASAIGRNGATEEDYGWKTNHAYPNNRTENVQNDYFGIVGGALNAVVSPLMDVLRPSRKENTVHSLRPYQNPKAKVAKPYLFNPERLGTTIRETTEQSIGHYNVESQLRGGGYEVTEVQPVNNNRMTTGDYYYAGGSSAGSGVKQPRTYDAEYNQQNNDIKSSVIRGYMVKGNMNLFNADVNVSQTPKDVGLLNERDVVPNMPIKTPDIMNMGMLQGSSNFTGSQQNIQTERNSSYVLENLKGNPYALSIDSAFQ